MLVPNSEEINRAHLLPCPSWTEHIDVQTSRAGHDWTLLLHHDDALQVNVSNLLGSTILKYRMETDRLYDRFASIRLLYGLGADMKWQHMQYW